MDPALGVLGGPAVSERLVARLWEEQRPLRFPLATIEGEEIQVVYRGRRRWDRGPDFAGALISWPGARLRCGEVEVHVRSSDWWAHGHHRDPHYDGVILQVVLWDDAPSPTVRADGATVPVVALAPCLSVPLERLLLAPQPAAPAPIPCWRGSTEEGALGAMLDGCGRDRLATKADRFEADLTCNSPNQLLYQGIAVALGYSQNRLPFRRLAERVPLDLLLAYRSDAETRRRGDAGRDDSLSLWEMVGVRAEATPCGDGPAGTPAPTGFLPLEALLLGAAGLLPSRRGLSSEGDPRAGALERAWVEEARDWVPDPMDPLEWEFFRVRPANFPTRRIAALAGLVARWPRDGMAETLLRLVSSLDPRALPRVLEDLVLLRSPDGYWGLHCDFGRGLRRPADLIGRQRAAEIAVNVFLPFLVAWASHRGDPDLARCSWELYRLYPKRGDNELSRYVATHLTGLPRPRVARSACRQQGLLHLYWSWCETKRCGECPAQGEG